MKFAKEIRIKDRALLDAVKAQPCVACGRVSTESEPNTPDHIATRGAGNDDVPENVWSLCLKHHTEKGMGFGKFIKKYKNCEEWLRRNNRTDVFERLERK